jgi:phage-related protein
VGGRFLKLIQSIFDFTKLIPKPFYRVVKNIESIVKVIETIIEAIESIIEAIESTIHLAKTLYDIA